MIKVHMVSAIQIKKHDSKFGDTCYRINAETSRVDENTVNTLVCNMHKLVDSDFRNRIVLDQGSDEYNEIVGQLVAYMLTVGDFSDVL